MQQLDTVDTGCREILGPCADRLLAAIRRARSRGNADNLHELRICARQLRQALGLFRDVIPRGERSHLRSDLRWLLRKTALARDHDVLMEEILDKATRHDRDSGYRIVTRLISARRTQARRRAITALAGPKCRRIESDLRNFACECRHQGMPETMLACDGTHAWRRAHEPLMSLANRGLRKHHEHPRRLSRSIRNPDLKGLHRLRIHIRAQHDRAKLLSDLFPRQTVKRYTSALKLLQRKLGAIHDLEIAQNLIHALPASSRIKQARKRLEHQCEKLFCARVDRLKDLRLNPTDLEAYWI